MLSKKLGIEVLDTKATAASHAMRAVPDGADQTAEHRIIDPRDPQWLGETLNQRIRSGKASGILIVDSVSVPEQLPYLRRSGWDVTHVHLEAPENVRRERCSLTGIVKRLWASAESDSIDGLKKIADVVIDTDRCRADDIVVRLVARLQDRPLLCEPVIDILVGGQYGSEGKGNIAQFLAPEYDVLVRVGGPNAGHTVYRTGMAPYTFRQLPSGALGNIDAKLVIGAGAVISLDVLLKEIGELSINFDKLLIDHRAMIIEKGDIEWEKQNLEQAIGSTAQGTGHATARKILNRMPDSDVRLAGTVDELKHYVGDSIEYFADCLSSKKRIMLEGTQGTSLSIHHGHYPHVTSRATTAPACLAEAGLAGRHVRRVVMVCRSYPIRVGDTALGNTSGYMSQTLQFEEIARRSGIDLDEIIRTEKGSVSGRPRRIAEFDWSQIRRSAMLNGPTDIALTFADYFGKENRKAYRYEQLNEQTLRFIEELERVVGVAVSLISTDFSERNIIDRRAW